MPILRPILVFTLTLAFASACGHEDTSGSDPDATFTAGEPSEYWTVINYWAVWCAPCREEIPELNELARKRADSVRVFGVNYDGARGETLAAAIRELGIEFPVLEVDPQPALGIARPQALPVTLVIKPDGTLLDILLGPQTADGLWQKLAGHNP